MTLRVCSRSAEVFKTSTIATLSVWRKRVRDVLIAPATSQNSSVRCHHSEHHASWDGDGRTNRPSDRRKLAKRPGIYGDDDSAVFVIHQSASGVEERTGVEQGGAQPQSLRRSGRVSIRGRRRIGLDPRRARHDSPRLQRGFLAFWAVLKNITLQ